MNPSNRVVLNAIATYARSILGAGLALFSSRWVLNALGDTDYGLFSVVGSIIVFITFLNNVMSGSASRHYAFSIGRDEPAEVNRWFNAALSIHLVLATILVFAGWLIGEYLILNVLTIPPDRLHACAWIFRLSLISAFVSMVSIPFAAMFTAKQHIAVLSIWGTLQSLMTFTLAWTLTNISGDRLFFYAVVMVCIVVFVQSAQILWASIAFQECRLDCSYWFNRHRVKEIMSFASWTFIGTFGTILRNQGSAILLNLYFGPTTNAAYGIANQVSTQSNQLAAAMIGALSPEITTNEGRGDRARMLFLSQRASKLGTLLVLLFAVPLMIEMNFVLKLWLIEPPMHTATFCQLILVTFILDRLSVGNMMAVIAHGRIAAYQATVGTCMLLTLPLAWLFLVFGASPVSVGIAFIITMIGVSAGRVFWARRLFNVPVLQWVSQVVLPCAAVAFTSAITAFMIRWLLPVSLLRFVGVIIISSVISLIATWFVAFDDRDRNFFRQNVVRLYRKALNRHSKQR